MKIINDGKRERINLGCGRQNISGYWNIDIVPFETPNGKQMVDMVLDIEKECFVFEGNSMKEIIVDNVLEHIGDGLIHALNECHRVLELGGILKGVVPVAGTKIDFMDITHKRHFTLDSFGYLCGEGLVLKHRPQHPKYADYGVLPWNKIELEQVGNLIYFILSPRK